MYVSTVLMAVTCAYKDSWNTCVINQKWIMDKFKRFTQVFKYFNETRKKYWKKIIYASTTTTTLTTKWKFRFTRGFMLVLEFKGFYSGASNILDIFKCPQYYF